MTLYVVLGVSLLVWISLFFYMKGLDGRISDLENRE